MFLYLNSRSAPVSCGSPLWRNGSTRKRKWNNFGGLLLRGWRRCTRRVQCGVVHAGRCTRAARADRRVGRRVMKICKKFAVQNQPAVFLFFAKCQKEVFSAFPKNKVQKSKNFHRNGKCRFFTTFHNFRNRPFPSHLPSSEVIPFSVTPYRPDTRRGSHYRNRKSPRHKIPIFQCPCSR